MSSECEPKSFFEGASKTDILSYLADAKERGLSTEGLSEDEKIIMEEEEDEDEKVLSDEDAGEKVCKLDSLFLKLFHSRFL